MEFSIDTTPPPFVYDSKGIIRVGGTRITLDTIIQTFKDGSTCEEIVYQYPVLKLSDVYSAVSYYLNNQEKVETYLEEHHRTANKIQYKIESHFEVNKIRDRLSKHDRGKK